jgi:CheY-like chemotaxis protein
MPATPVRILLAEDDDDDYLLTTQALTENRLINTIHRVRDGVELLQYLYREGCYAAPASAPTPSLILLDLNMPRKDGREALREIKGNAELRRVPVVVLTTSRAQEDIVRSYDLGVNSFITKPVGFHGLVDAVKVLGRYWFEVVELPEGERHGLRRTA